MSNLRIVLADDHPVVREGLKALLNAEADLSVVGEACNGAEALAQLEYKRPDLLLTDISMPGQSGVELAKQVAARWPMIRVLALSVHEEIAYVQQLLAVGASGYVLKRSASAELITAVRSVTAGEIYIDPLVAGRLVGTMVDGPHAYATRRVPLSEREHNVLRMIAQGYSNKEVAATLAISAKTVETYKARAMEKLGLSSRVAIVGYAVECGWLS